LIAETAQFFRITLHAVALHLQHMAALS